MQQKCLLLLDLPGVLSSYKLQEAWATHNVHYLLKEAFYYYSAKLEESMKRAKQAVTIIWVVVLFKAWKGLLWAIVK